MWPPFLWTVHFALGERVSRSLREGFVLRTEYFESWSSSLGTRDASKYDAPSASIEAGTQYEMPRAKC